MVKTAINTLIPKQATSSLRITTHGTKQATSKDLKGTKVNKVFKVATVKTELKVYQVVMDVTAQQVVTDVMDATVKMS